MKTQQEQIAERREQIPKIHKANYAKAMRGNSMKAGIKAFCLECVGWEREQVRLCTDLACPLYPYKPYKSRSKQASQGPSLEPESIK